MISPVVKVGFNLYLFISYLKSIYVKNLVRIIEKSITISRPLKHESRSTFIYKVKLIFWYIDKYFAADSDQEKICKFLLLDFGIEARHPLTAETQEWILSEYLKTLDLSGLKMEAPHSSEQTTGMPILSASAITMPNASFCAGCKRISIFE